MGRWTNGTSDQWEEKTASTRPLLLVAVSVKLMSSPRSQQPQHPRQHASFSGRADLSIESLQILQLNIEGLTIAKLDVFEQITTKNKATVVLLQETHKKNDAILKLPGQCADDDAETEWIATKVQETTVVNVYKPPPSRLDQGSLPDVPAPALYAGDFNSWQTDWGYKTINKDGEFLADWVLLSRRSAPLRPEGAPLVHLRTLEHQVQPRPGLRQSFRARTTATSAHLGVIPSHTTSPITNHNTITDPVDGGKTSPEVELPQGELGKLRTRCQHRCRSPASAYRHQHRLRIRGLPQAKSNVERATAATDLLNRLKTKRRERWTETVESIDSTHSSRRAWQTINKLTGQGTKPKPCPITVDAIAAQLISNGRFPNADKAFTRKITGEVNDLRRAPCADRNLSGDFTNDKIVSALKHLKPNKAAGIDNIHPEFILHQGSQATERLRSFCSVCYRSSKLPKIWCRAKVIALPKPSKPMDDPKGYWPIALLCVPKSTVDQVTLLTRDIKDTFQKGEKAGVVLLNLRAAYDTVWLRGLHLKLLQTIPDRHMVGFIMEMLSNRSFTLHTSDGQHSRLRRLKNGIPQGSVLAPMLFNIYIHDLPDTLMSKYGYVDNLTIMFADKGWETIESGLMADMDTLSTYLSNWHLKLSVAKTMSSAFHLNNREASRELNIIVNNNRLQFQATPTYLGVKLDRTYPDVPPTPRKCVSKDISPRCPHKTASWHCASPPKRWSSPLPSIVPQSGVAWE
ncbi:uncharacterized protein LOC119743290 [Patiria miniata]|uniref:Reverse transcriptase domain-containing protein n=1 Tax=Patiria miniata TaxID=46514 RepID=A0A914BIE4_PATMI|nr:uncharacterized protein LOC119743290 [Patiria miniata]